MRASYLSDPLREMTSGAIALLQGSREMRFSLDDEPGEHRWILREEDGESIHLTILGFPEPCGNKPDDRGEVLLKVKTTRCDFASEVLKTLKNILTTMGEAEYKKQWIKHDFPHDRYKVLKSLF